MSVPRAKSNKKYRTYQISEKQLKRIKDRVAEEVTEKVMIIFLGMLAEEGWKDEDLVRAWLRVNQIAGFVDEKRLWLREIAEIIENKTGVKLKGRW